GDESGPVVVNLKPSGTITGRVVDQDGQPIVGSSFQMWYDDGPGRPGNLIRGGMAARLTTAAEKARGERTGRPNFDKLEYSSSNERTDDDGRFKIPGIFPGLAF